MATNFSVKIGEIGLFTFISRPGIRKWIVICNIALLILKGSSAMIWLHRVNIW